MARSTLTSLLKQLDVQSAQNEHADVETTCMALLDGGCANPTQVLKNLLVSLIKQDKYQKAFNQLKNHQDGKVDLNEMILEIGYIYYKINRFDDFEKLEIYQKVKDANKDDELTRGLTHLYAQYALKNSNTNSKAYELYRDLASENPDDIDNPLELACNERVPLTTNPVLQDKAALVSDSNTESYDLLLNESMILSGRGDYPQAIELLNKSLKLATEEGYENDIFAIQLQLSYVYQLMGENVKCKEILKPLLLRIPNENPLHLIAQNNYMALRDLSKYEDNFNLILRELNFEKINSLSTKFFTYPQNVLLNRNFQMLSLYSKSTSKPNNKSFNYVNISKLYGTLIDDIVLEPFRTQAKRLFHKCLEKRKEFYTNSLVFGLLILTIQILYKEQQYNNAIKLCDIYLSQDKFSANNRLSIFIYYIACQLFDITGQDNLKENLLKKLLANSKLNDYHLWKYVGFQFLNLGQLDNAKKVFQEKISADMIQNDVLIQSVLNEEQFNVDKASDLVSNIDVDELIELNIKPFESILHKNKSNINKQNKIIKHKLKAKKEKRKAHKLKKFLEKHGDTINLQNKPDPERWLPLRDRSTYRPKKKQLAKQTQGGAMNKKAEQSLDITKKSTNSNISKKKGKGKGKGKGRK
ncbi:signal recognition particle subunit Srp72p [Monosporozyma servazzii]